MRISDEVTVDDILKTIDVVRIQDETATTEDILYKAPVTFVISDEASVQDTLRATAIMLHE